MAYSSYFRAIAAVTRGSIGKVRPVPDNDNDNYKPCEAGEEFYEFCPPELEQRRQKLAGKTKSLTLKP